VQHDNTNYSASFVVGRANLSSVKRYDVNDTTNNTFTITSSKYNTAGAIVSSKDASNHEVTVSYTDRFSENGVDLDPAKTFVTLAYATTVNDADGYSSKARYDYDFGVVTWKQTPQPNVTTNTPGPEQTFTFDSKGRLERSTSVVNNARERYIYGPNYVESWSTVNNVADEAHSIQVFDGAGRAIATAINHPGSEGGFSGRITIYDAMGRTVKQSNPTETSISLPEPAAAMNPYAWSASGADASWIYTQQTYDWKGRPLVTTNQDGSTKMASYSGCGCAGGEVVTLTDEGTTVDIDASPALNNVTKKRQQKIYSDVLGRTVKTEILNWQGGSVYSTAVVNYNARDQVTSVKQYQGTETSGIFKEASTTYDGFGRLKTRHVPEQKADPNISGSTDHTTWEYNADDTVQSITDARGITSTFGYNARHLLTSLSLPPAQNLPSGIPATSNVTYSYDAAGNRTSMSDVSGNSVNYTYDSLSRLLSEARQFAGLTGTYTLAYEYNLVGQVKKVTDQSASTSFSYVLDSVGRLTTINSTGLGASAPLASNASYFASGALKQWAYGNGTGVNLAFNSRGLIAQYSLTGVKEFNGTARAEGSDFVYHADGQVKFASDFYGRSFSTISAHDKSYQHDQVGRLQVAFSGVEAVDFLNNNDSGPFTGSSPYLQTYTHDVWNNMVDRDGIYWSEWDELETQTYDAHNRNSAWSYDANGRLLSMNEPAPDANPFVPAQHTYDAAGQHVKHTQTTSQVTQLPGNPVWTTITTVDASYDGDGQQYKRVETKQINSQQPTSETRFFLSSSVLTGQVIAEYDGQGVRQKSYVYGGGTLITSSPSEGLIWLFNNPVTGDGRETDSQGRVTISSYLDSQGADVGATDPANNQGEPPPPDPLPHAGAYAAYLPHYLGGSGRCRFEGMEVGCGFMASLEATGFVRRASGSNIRAIYGKSEKAYVGFARWDPRAARDGIAFLGRGSTGFVPIRWNYHPGEGFSLPGGFSLTFPDGIPNDFKDSSIEPQNSTIDTIPSDLKARVMDMVGNCSETMAKFLTALGRHVYSQDLGKTFDRIKSIQVDAEPFKAPFVPKGATGLSGDRKIFILPNELAAKLNQEFRWNAVAKEVVQELLHQSRDRGLFSDEELDKAGLQLLSGQELIDAKSEMNAKNYQKGTVGHRVGASHCNPTNPYGPPPRK
jgi:YD repeat-containing protein